jgi:hypothetical protein
MAEVVLKVGSVSPDPLTYQDGDIICAMSDHRIQSCHAEQVCHPRMQDGSRPLTGHGLHLDPLGLLRIWLNNTYTYRIERISQTEIRRVNLIDLTDDIFGPTPNTNGEAIDVPQFVARALAFATDPSTQGAGRIMLGSPGAEEWWGGPVRQTPARLDVIWTAIETQTPLRRVDHGLWPLGALDRRAHLALAVDDMSEATMTRLSMRDVEERVTAVDVASVSTGTRPDQWVVTLATVVSSVVRSGDRFLDGARAPVEYAIEAVAGVLLTVGGDSRPSRGASQPEIISHIVHRKRRHNIHWRDLSLSRAVSEIEDTSIPIDVRSDAVFQRSAVVTDRAPGRQEPTR